jgi:hypothetical protein
VAFAAFALAFMKSLVTTKTSSTINFARTTTSATTKCAISQHITDFALCGLRFFHGEGVLVGMQAGYLLFQPGPLLLQPLQFLLQPLQFLPYVLFSHGQGAQAEFQLGFSRP